MSRVVYYIAALPQAGLLFLAGRELWQLMAHLCQDNDGGSVLEKFHLYQWMLCGVLVYTLLHAVVHKNIQWLEAFSHEFTHVVVSLIFMRDIRAMNVRGEGSGEAITSGSPFASIPISLAPYCLPLFTFLLLALRPLINQSATPLMIFDILTGLTLGFHIHCFASQTRAYQTDIRRFTLLFSFLHIATFWCFNASVILVAYWQSKNVFTAVWYVVRNLIAI